jgi:ABC-2 type transport system permease protein
MNNLTLTLVQREWLQHRFGWSLLLLVPTALALLLFSFGHLQFDTAELNDRLPVALALASIGGAVGLYGLIWWLTSLIIVSGLARRDHGDRSIEFWLSLPVGNARSLAVPLGVHLLLAPAVAMLAALVAGAAISLVLVTRVAGPGAWLALPWFEMLAAGLAIVARLTLGLVLATLWLSPLIMVTVLLSAWFRRWGVVILSVGIGLGSVVLDRVFGQPVLTDLIGHLFAQAGRSVANSGQSDLVVNNVSDVQGALTHVPSWAWHDGWQAVGLLASPVLAGAVAVAAGAFVMLVRWRQGGAGVGG